MNVNLSENVVFELQNIQKNRECINEALKIIEDFIYETDEGGMNPNDALAKFNTLRNVRYLKSTLTKLYSD